MYVINGALHVLMKLQWPNKIKNINLRLFNQHPTLNDELPNRILSGTVQVKPNRSFQGSSVEFDDGSVVEDVDLVVCYFLYSYSLTYNNSLCDNLSSNHCHRLVG